ncbi:aminotransferase class IV [Carboxylicivirga sediminis]|uniref:branched-chain-amino-acid transaminase n=1 Tax=Carboxylicivirga sediminis TaxID=2006564 RepID=A0A941F4U6_9BACT|nr:aminotransferase class IV [Carboxylicivirga sediminis]MBR8535958.1 aminotransferase class IV [Carboxylicivirga sediminis]
MQQPFYIVLNGHRLLNDTPVLRSENRAFRYGDALFETIRCMHQRPLWFTDHYQRLLNGMSLLKMDVKSLPPAGILAAEISTLIQKNRLFGDVRARLTIFREEGGLYTPAGNKVNYLIEVSPLTSNGYELNNKGLLIDVYTSEQKPINHFSHYKTANALLFVMAGLFKKEQGKDDVLILNSHHHIIEGLASNLFWVINQEVFTPLRSTGCVDGIMRKQIIRLLRENHLRVHEVSGTDLNTLLQAEEVFLSNAIQGIQWVVGLKQKRYFCKLSKDICRWLNEDAANYMQDSQES